MELPTWADYPWTLEIFYFDGDTITELHRTFEAAQEAAPDQDQAVGWIISPTRS
jgi:hypothetical protein